MNYTLTLTLNLNITKEQIDEIIDTAGYGIGYWAKVAIIDDDYYQVVCEDGVRYILTNDAICTGINQYITNGNMPYNIMEFDGNNINLDTTMVDSVVADMIIQYACFGEIIYV